jgi:predicted transcriptional regulator
MYKIEITHVEQVNRQDRSYEKVADTGNERDGGPVYEYVTFDAVKNIERKVLEQVVDNLDLAAVIKAINGLT